MFGWRQGPSKVFDDISRGLLYSSLQQVFFPASFFFEFLSSASSQKPSSKEWKLQLFMPFFEATKWTSWFQFMKSSDQNIFITFLSLSLVAVKFFLLQDSDTNLSLHLKKAGVFWI